jgi:uncharacterized delta-60 repeat protein
VRAIAVQTGGSILIGGGFAKCNGTARGNVAQLNTDGSLDTSFLATGAGANSTVLSVAAQTDGKILIGGYFSTYNGTARGSVARLNKDGSLDTSFLATGSGAGGSVGCVAVQADGKILIAGAFGTYNGTSRGGLARLNADGSLDTSFLATGAGVNGYVNSLAVQTDGKVLIAGVFSTCNGTARGCVARLNTDGTLDTSFLATGAGTNYEVWSIAVQTDGKILIGGEFPTYNGIARGHVARLNTDGSLDASFLAAGSGASGSVHSLAVQTDGKILIGGYFSTYNDTLEGNLARLNTDGSLDTSFLGGGGANSIVYSVAMQADGKILIGGTFSTYNGTARGGIARVWN